MAKQKRTPKAESLPTTSAETLTFVNDLTAEERRALRYFMANMGKYKNLVLLATLHTMPMADRDGPIPQQEILDAVTCLSAALHMECVEGGVKN